ncbi:MULTISPECIES: BglG family transcription antiterminator [unclassified Clostridium]|uniref:BglG family transcription antiterminator n=1 Tax=unclassified Clostridium TaxID=2614128 RepID=UPI00290DBEA1|nr:BglG family transcription antiterminator [Clostridium sp.]MDU5106082.1 BglG family transcription antiterminator [Clostridium sp.]
MLNLNSRQKDLIKMIINEVDYKTMKYYASSIKVSPRTIYTDIEIINDNLKDFKVTIEKKPRVGIKLTGDTENIIKVIKILNNKINIENVYSSEERQLDILKMLLVNEETISYQKLSEYFWVSKTSISKDMEAIESFLNNKTVLIKSDKKGTRIIGSEEQIQYTLKLYTEDLLSKKSIENEKDFLKHGPKILKPIYPEELVDIIFEEVANFEKTLNISLTYYYLKSLTITLIIFVFRLSKNHHIKFKKNFIFEEIKSLETYFIAKSTLESISTKFKISINNEDVDYLNKQLIAHCISPKISNEKQTKKYENVVKEAISEMSQIMNVNLKGDKKLYEGLLFHIVPMVYRLHIGIMIENPLLREIKEQYSVTFNATWYVMSKISEKLDIVLNEDEVAFIMVHFQAAIDRNAQVKKILIVCPTGIGSSELIANKIKRFLPSKDIIEVVPIRKIYENRIDNVDLIISSVQLDIEDKPVIYVSPLVSNEDLKNISQIYTDIFIDTKKSKFSYMEKKKKYKYINNLMDESLIFTNCKFDKKEDCLSYMIDAVIKKDLVYSGFKESIMEREKLGSTSLDSAVAIPHALPSTVKHSVIGIMTLDKNIKWSGKAINTIILICISEKDIKNVKNILSEVYDIVESKERVKEIFLGKNKKEIFDELGGV